MVSGEESACIVVSTESEVKAARRGLSSAFLAIIKLFY
jgi:hypothetical protein